MKAECKMNNTIKRWEFKFHKTMDDYVMVLNNHVYTYDLIIARRYILSFSCMKRPFGEPGHRPSTCSKGFAISSMHRK